MWFQKRSVSTGLALTCLILITTFYVAFHTNESYIESKTNQLDNVTIHPELLSPRVLCLILTTPKYFLDRVKAVNDTWGPRCDRYLFVTDYTPQTMTPEQINFTQQIPIAPIQNITPGYDHLTQKTTLAFLFAYEKYFNDFDWFVKADDDTYLIVENLKAFLSQQNASEPVTFGYNFKVIVPKGYHSGGASYVLSRESLRRFYEAHKDPTSTCLKDGGNEDIEIARCLRTKDVYPGQSLDKQNRELFHTLSYTDHFRGNFPDWLKKYAENPLQTGDNCCSDQTISFHYIDPDKIYLMDFLLYKTRSRNVSQRKK
ncbi:unnamed protein product [Adineta steineri]|uniref:N-acetylgalactosaminide beta-1,3-galactosyltransferase n=1 Tax=Adineta steineri TaxID=433720 RepID=A0A814P6Q7_9BILA|nr:unnamed protein product [Adineta steineri]CAF1312686.1 unnamed protein product [Adineta steineri]CAF1313548.1 unnamed protein product [Adineta steineri]